MIQKVAIQGIKGSFHDQVVEQYYTQAPELMECLTFDALAKAVVSGGCDQAVMAIENSIAGSILSNYAILDQYELVITGEYYLSIEHNLMALPVKKLRIYRKSIPILWLCCSVKNFSMTTLILN